MCGILCTFGEKILVPEGLLKHRGPDDFRREHMGKCLMDFYRLAINDPTETGMQPFRTKKDMFVCNGEIYNYREFVTGKEKGTSDCEVIPEMLRKFGTSSTVDMLRGDFAFVYTDGVHVQAARDPIGVRPLFYTRFGEKNSIAFASEMKALKFIGTKVHVFPPGHFYDSRLDDFVCYYKTYWNPLKTIPKNTECIRRTLEDAVRVRLATTERDVGFLLSGGLDSSLICAIAQRMSKKPIKTFSIGLPRSPDLDAARKVANFLGTEHTEVNFTVEEGKRCVKEIIRTLESYDTTTIRASIPMYLLCKYIKENTSCRYIFSGEGSDELLGGYLYFKNAPSVEDFAYENMRRLRLIHQFDGLRADRCAGAHGLDLIVPFLDKEFIACCMTMNQSLKVDKVEKRILRESFEGYLPPEVLWRTKDAFSDAVGEDWVASLRKLGKWEHVNTVRNMCRGVNLPITAEEAFYRDLFWKMYDSRHDYLIREIWRPKWTEVTDPSARLLIEEDVISM